MTSNVALLHTLPSAFVRVLVSGRTSSGRLGSGAPVGDSCATLMLQKAGR